MPRLCWIPAILSCSAAFAQTPAYTEEARAARLQGTVVLAVMTGEDGKPLEVQVRHSLGLGLDENAVQAVRSRPLQPGFNRDVRVEFRLPQDANSWHVARAAFSTPEGATRPVLLKARYPQRSSQVPNATVSVSFDVSEQGVPVNVRVEDASDAASADEVIALIREWRFLAALKQGIPVQARGFIDFAMGDPAWQPDHLLANGLPPVRKKK
jgi:TonB family protein